MCTKYRSYPDHVKEKIALTKNPYLFPDLGIPRTTASYWIKNRGSLLGRNLSVEASQLGLILAKEKAKVVLLTELKDCFIYFEKSKTAPKENQMRTIRAITKARQYLKLKDCLTLLSLAQSKYKRWAYSKKVCLLSLSSKCKKKHPSQLSQGEVEKIRILYKKRKYSYFSNTSLHKLAVKKQYVSCSKETWFKYIKILKIQRTVKKKRKVKYPIGIRATQKNEILHIDITHLRLKNGTTIYLQVLMDNFTRKIISWTLSKSKSHEVTIDTLKKVLNKKSFRESFIMSDAGSENLNYNVKKVLIGSKLRQLIAKSDIHFSNSIVEAFFRSMKSNFLHKISLKSFNHAKNKVKFYINKHNSVIPHAAFKWATPNEVYRGITDEHYQECVGRFQKEQTKARLEHNKLKLCSLCV